MEKESEIEHSKNEERYREGKRTRRSTTRRRGDIGRERERYRAQHEEGERDRERDRETKRARQGMTRRRGERGRLGRYK